MSRSVVESINVNDEHNSDAVYFKSTLHQMDIERVRYSLCRYLRARCGSCPLTKPPSPNLARLLACCCLYIVGS